MASGPAVLAYHKIRVMTEHYRVRVADDSTVFAACHFITYDGGVCEPLHGHNFRTSVTVEGSLDRNQYVVDFVALKKMVAARLAELDHRVLLPTAHDQIRVEVRGDEVEVLFPGRRWVFPRSECALLPVANTTAELLARHLAQGLIAPLSAAIGDNQFRVLVEVEESPGWSATCGMSGNPARP
ncbi:MAG: 6-pyruvoyl trahydropterin synthase family protein [Thermoguttaceae bacterium]